MVEVEYVGLAHVRTISKKEWKAAGLEDQEALSIDARVNRFAQVSEEAAKLLTEREGKEWKVHGTTPEADEEEVSYSTGDDVDLASEAPSPTDLPADPQPPRPSPSKTRRRS